ncbi:MAG TPA: hydrogenase maturation protease [candidate division Zixibacteria bacterium]|nr:hydrogenase maturation protease [candidate division Zixibacteria bacterium]MDD4916670.1 hydrogenase maturation protease [candidate division Zixibacteria bacterium]MDM7973228.1 hydrogenase maturation protease [candidate division Zixibacteria bacterium]HOD66020.1 hydrogenase maturation protease [candidate division Zixibacteria bacterium]HOZ06828.1 hydrogenase maturation protease [candidate division Zixibacteria bacterium]
MMKPVVMGMGNELFGDDGFGIIAARRLAPLAGEAADVIECGAAGLALLDPLIGRPRAVIIDAICTGRQAPGTIYRVSPADLRDITNLSPHYAGLPEVIRMAQRLELPIPDTIDIIAIEAADITTMGAGLSPAVAAALEPVVALAVELLLGGRRTGSPAADAQGISAAGTHV